MTKKRWLRCRTFFNKTGVRLAVATTAAARVAIAAKALAKDIQMHMEPGHGVASAPGTPPHIQSGLLVGSVEAAPSGPLRWVAGPTDASGYGALHEWGGLGEWGRYPPRPFVRPALARMAPLYKKHFLHMKLGSTPAGRSCSSSVDAWFRSVGRR